MSDIKVKLSYWVYPEGDDFESIEYLKDILSKDYDTEIVTQKTDAMGGGLYEILVEVVNDINFADVAKDLIEDAIKGSIVYFWKPIFKQLKSLFAKNKKFRPDIEAAKFIFRDVEIIVFPLYEGSINEVIDEVIKEVAKKFSYISENLSFPVKSIYIPIFNHVDTYEICAYRVRLNVDENISSFSRNDYFRFWGIRDSQDINYIYELNKNNFLKTKFYTQPEYDELLDKKFEADR